jgi:hypothetical protein
METLQRLRETLYSLSEALCWIGEPLPRPVEALAQACGRQFRNGEAFPRPEEALYLLSEALHWIGERLPRPTEGRKHEPKPLYWTGERLPIPIEPLYPLLETLMQEGEPFGLSLGAPASPRQDGRGLPLPQGYAAERERLPVLSGQAQDLPLPV